MYIECPLCSVSHCISSKMEAPKIFLKNSKVCNKCGAQLNLTEESISLEDENGCERLKIQGTLYCQSCKNNVHLNYDQVAEGIFDDSENDLQHFIQKIHNLVDSIKENANNQKTSVILQVDYVKGDKFINGNKTTGVNSPITDTNNSIVQSYNVNEINLANKLQSQGITKEQTDELITILRKEKQNTENRTLGTEAKKWCENIKIIGFNVLSNLIFTIMYGLPPL